MRLFDGLPSLPARERHKMVITGNRNIIMEIKGKQMRKTSENKNIIKNFLSKQLFSDVYQH